MTTRHVLVDTPLGPITIVGEDDVVTGLYFRHHIRRPDASMLGPAVARSDDGLLDVAAEQVLDYLTGARRGFDLPVRAGGDPFQQAVWRHVLEIPFGETTTYGRIAEHLGDRSLAQKVGQAVGANPLCVMVPCHRVVASNGALTGYAGGLKRKRALLDLELPEPAISGRLF